MLLGSLIAELAAPSIRRNKEKGMSIKTPALAEEVVDPDEAAVVAQFVEFLKATSRKHHPTGTIPRFNQGRGAGCVDAEFIVPEGLPQELRVGLFAQPATYRARIRFANATSQSDKERDVRGFPAHWDPKLRIPRGQVVAAASIVSPKY